MRAFKENYNLINLSEFKSSDLSIQNQKLIAENKNKDEFIASISHEIRNPLNAVINFCEMIKKSAEKKLNEEELEFLDYIASSGQEILAFTNDLLDVIDVKLNDYRRGRRHKFLDRGKL